MPELIRSLIIDVMSGSRSTVSSSDGTHGQGSTPNASVTNSQDRAPNDIAMNTHNEPNLEESLPEPDNPIHSPVSHQQ